MTNTLPFGHLSFYQFLPLPNLPDLKSQIFTLGTKLNLMGTVLLASEGINASITGSHSSIEEFKKALPSLLPLNDAPLPKFKEMAISEHSFKRFFVKIKKEIISMGEPDIQPDLFTGIRLSPSDFKKWMDEKRPMVLLDTRNKYEVAVGTFEEAVHLESDTFRECGKKLKDFPITPSLPIVTFCTGGIRCEKASALLMKQGHKNVYQLDGGILAYLEEVGPSHFQGNCFVFDWRMAVQGDLTPGARSSEPDKQFGRHKQNRD